MFYESDFRTLPSRFQPRYDYRRSFARFKGKHNVKVNVISPSGKTVTTEKQRNMFHNWFLDFCGDTSVHGMKYIGQTNLHWSERIIWGILVLLAILSIVYISLELSEKFSHSPLSTVVESTIFPVAEIAYPAVTICNRNRFHRGRCEEAEGIFIPGADDDTLEIFRMLLLSMNSFEFGALDEFYEEIFNFTSPQLTALNLTELFEFVMLTCEEVFVGRCWWRNKYFDCCDDFFYQQRSEYGICYSFNSAVSPLGLEKEANKSIHYPVRTSNYGDWSGLRVDLSARTDMALSEENDGVLVIVQHPDQWPNAALFVPSGTQTAITIKPTYSYTTEDVRRLTPEQRQCLNENESKSSLTLPGLKYLQLNCISQCRQEYMAKYCNCSVETFFPLGNFSSCDFEDLKCLYKHNDIFNYEKPPTGNPFFDDNDEGMECPCLPECNRVDYAIEVAPNILPIGDNMTLDFHFQSANIVKYRTDVTFGWLDLMVSFGGIAGLFLGCSIISGVEIVYYILIITLIVAKKVFIHIERFFSAPIKSNQKNEKRQPLADSVRVIKVQSLSDFDNNAKANKARY